MLGRHQAKRLPARHDHAGRTGRDGRSLPCGRDNSTGTANVLYWPTKAAQRSIWGRRQCLSTGRDGRSGVSGAMLLPGAVCRVFLQHEASARRDSVSLAWCSSTLPTGIKTRNTAQLKAAMRHAATKERLAVWWMAALPVSSHGWWRPTALPSFPVKQDVLTPFTLYRSL